MGKINVEKWPIMWKKCGKSKKFQLAYRLLASYIYRCCRFYFIHVLYCTLMFVTVHTVVQEDKVFSICCIFYYLKQ